MVTFTSQYVLFFLLVENILFLADSLDNEEASEFREIKIEETEYNSDEQNEITEESDVNQMEEGGEELGMYEVFTEQDDDGDLIEEVPAEQEFNDKDMYTCNLCQVNFYSIDEHVAQYHENQQVIVEVCIFSQFFFDLFLKFRYFFF